MSSPTNSNLAFITESTVAAGFPSPAESYSESPLDLNELLISKPHATFFIRARGDSMQGAGVFDDDLLVVDRSIEPLNGHVVVAALNGEFTLKRLVKSAKGLQLHAENKDFAPIIVNEESDFQVWGVATHVIHKL